MPGITRLFSPSSDIYPIWALMPCGETPEGSRYKTLVKTSIQCRRWAHCPPFPNFLSTGGSRSIPSALRNPVFIPINDLVR